MKKTAILLALTIVTGALFSACSLLPAEEKTPMEGTENGTSVDLSVEVLPEGSVPAEDSAVSIPLAVVVE